MEQKRDILQKYIPKEAVGMVVDLTERYPCHLKVVNKRRSKHGDFKKFSDGRLQITINNDLNPYRFLLTLIHEFAHLVTFEEYRKVRPHGQEWKYNFKLLMLPFLKPNIFPNEILSQLALYLINPKASSDGDVKLSAALRNYDAIGNKTLIFEIPDQAEFKFQNRTFIKGKKRRTRYECIEVMTHKKYTFHPHAEVDPLNKNYE